MPHIGPGSTGSLSALRINSLISKWFIPGRPNPTSAQWTDAWTSRAVSEEEVELPYPIAGGNANTAAGWYGYVRDLVGSTRTISSGTNTGIPGQAFRDLSTDVVGLDPSGTSDVDNGQRTYNLLVSTRGPLYLAAGGAHRMLMCAWAAVGSSAIGSS